MVSGRFGTRRDRRVYPKHIFTDVEERVSRIHGVGQFALRSIRAGELIDDRRNNVGYNHSDTPNLVRRVDHVGRFVGVFALRDIRNGEELTLNYGLKEVVDADGSIRVAPNLFDGRLIRLE